ncbi:MAG: UDP-N-acetylglucosamine 1-carboxyvinyltransferase [Candidatus Komeilibacteria bacterium]|nr:UDP-N-acetylglucosamine 1-carboxyvinyltransferase [Candidatus Komeilibacteria bacterium]
MSKFIIQGGKKLSGAWRVQGMKNAATPILAATLLTREECVLHNIPRISDLEHMLSILRTLGSEITWEDEHTLRIRTREIKTTKMDYLLTKRMRSSVLFLGPILAGKGEVTMPEPGGCNIGNRPLDTHFAGFEGLGAKIEFTDGNYTILGKKLQGNNIVLKEKSVTATENIMMLAAAISGQTIINNAAAEPHVASLGRFLRSLGAKIQGEGTNIITIEGVGSFSGTDFTIIPDQLEVGTIAILAAVAGGEITIGPLVPADMAVVADKLKEAGVYPKEGADYWIIKQENELRAFNVKTAPYPGFPTDLQAPFGVLATQADGESIIHDPMYENRLGYINELAAMGAKAAIIDSHTAKISGPTPLQGQDIESLDLRAGATLVIAGLIAKGQTIINNADIIDRGYEAFAERLQALGADIKRIE